MKSGLIFKRIRGRIVPILRKNSEVVKAGAELTGLGLLAYPNVKHATGKGQGMSEKKKSRYELAGLGVLGAATFSSTAPALSKILKKLAKLK